MKNNCPTAPIINSLEGTYRGESVQNVLAVRSTLGAGYIEDGGGYDFDPSRPKDTIIRWEDVTTVPVSKLKALRRAWYGPGGDNAYWLRTVEAAMLDVLEALPARVSHVTRAAKMVFHFPTSRVQAESNLRERVIELFRAVDAVNTYEDKVYALTKMARLAADWANLEDLEGDALEDIRDQAEDIHSSSNSDKRDIIMLALLVGQVTEAAAFIENLRPALLSLGSYALAWAAELIGEANDYYEEEDDE